MSTTEPQRMLVSVAHPDDETFGLGSVIADAVDRGVEVTVCCATRGEAGEVTAGVEVPGGRLADLRVRELREAGALLGVTEVVVLDFVDSGMEGETAADTLVGAPFASVVDAVARVVERVRPDIVVTLDPTGGDGHRDHVRIAQATTEAVAAAAGFGASLYHWCVPRSLLVRWLAEQRVAHPELGHLALDTSELGRPDDEITTVLDQTAHVDLRRRAVTVHRSQRSPYEGMSADLVDTFLGSDRLVRAAPAWTGGPVETSLVMRDRPVRDGEPR
jgi:LmbE family N-acetylglucosaminyl deacetylase